MEVDRCGMQRREIEARPVILLITFRSSWVLFLWRGAGLGKGRGAIWGEGTN